MRAFGAMWVAVGLLGAVCAAAESPAQEGRVPVLDTYGNWHMRSMLAPPVRASGEEGALPRVWMAHKTPPPPEGWEAPDFDDRFWNRGSLVRVPKTGILARACIRGKFAVTDASAVEALWLSARYRGGIVVYLNGQEVHRAHREPGREPADGPGGEEREIVDLALPTDRLRNGTNVLALDVVRAPYPESGGQPGEFVYDIKTCEVLEVRLSAPSRAGLIPNAVRPEGLQAWNSDPLAGDHSLDQGDAGVPLQPVTIIGARNGLFSGKVVLGSTRPIRGLKVAPGAISGPGGAAIPADHVEVRYGVPWGEERLADTGLYHGQWLRDSPYLDYTVALGALADAAPDEVPVLHGQRQASFYTFPRGPQVVKAVPAAVVPLWLRVRTPADAAPGTYTGSLRVQADGEEPIDVPLELRVADYVLPTTQDYRTWVDIIQCPDTLALEYDIPLWSDRHFDMIARSFRLIGETGSRIVYIPLIAHTNLGNEQSMVRWIKREDGGYDHDFSIMERYLDVARETMGTPKLIVFVVWDVYMIPKETDGKRRTREVWHTAHLDKIGAEYGQGPMVTVLDPATGETDVLNLPPHEGDPADKALWQPVVDGVRERLRARGLEDAMMFGLHHDTWAGRDDVALFNDLAPDVPWAMHSHEGHKADAKMYGIAQVAYQACVWAVAFSDDGTDRGERDKGRITSRMGWNREHLIAQFDRVTRDDHPNTRWRHLAETCITGSQRGPGRLGAEYWKVVRNARGERASTSFERYPESSWRNLFIASSLIVPGPEGPAAGRRLEALREGVQECEARITIERALYDAERRARLGDDLARRCEEYLHERHMMLWQSLWSMQCYYRYPEKQERYEGGGWRTMPNVSGHNWFLGSGYQERNQQLFALAGEVARALR
ncbi:MAG: hypothetical protein GXY85_03680 [Candidatus Brocadiaceae bacterium]|nr:hypothetical protein [Candidatus Brocadiaceae bacterium]